jgi:alginate O-acetyltransferase complex protein AlgI
MLFTSYTFLYFHLVVVTLRWLLPRRLVAPWLLLSSYVFYLSWGAQYGLLIGGMTVFAWGLGLVLSREGPGRARWLALAVAVLLTILAVFKYTNFVAAQVVALARLVHHPVRPWRVDVVLPLAISFYTFELISYVVDVARGDPAERSLPRFALYVAYYPHLIAGPIVRAHELLPALHEDKKLDGELFADGVYIALVGYLKKAVIADRLAPLADEVFRDPTRYSTFGVWMGVIAYTGQIYCDFSGYTDIARGASMTLGYPLPDNFDTPYLARSITEFWRRWHMTLSRWLRDYLYIALGGNRRGVVMQYRNLFLTMLLGGLWHGARWTFVAWGAYHGVLLALHKFWDARARRVPWLVRARKTPAWSALAGALTLLSVMVGWVFFRATDFGVARTVLARMVRPVAGAGGLAAAQRFPSLHTAILFSAALAVGHVLAYHRVGVGTQRALHPIARGLYWFGLLAACWLFAQSRAQFIYFQF